MELKLNGLHVTTQYHADNIVKNGFVVNNNNAECRAGKGAYFWHYENDTYVANIAADAWYSFCVKKNIYLKDNNGKVIFDVSIKGVTEESLLDMTDGDVLGLFAKAFLPQESDTQEDSKQKENMTDGQKLDMFIRSLQSITIDAVKINLSTPRVKDLKTDMFGTNSFPAIILKNQKEVIINSQL